MAKKPSPGLSEFFDESVPANALSVMKQNYAFAASDKGEPVYLCVMLDTEVIGGIDRKTKNDKAVGGVIEKVRGGLIDAYVTAETNENKQLVFIPTMKTLDALADYSKFTKPEWELVKVKDDESIERTGMMITYRDMLAIAKQTKSLQDFLTNLVAEQREAAKQAEADAAAQEAAPQPASPYGRTEMPKSDELGSDEFSGGYEQPAQNRVPVSAPAAMPDLSDDGTFDENFEDPFGDGVPADYDQGAYNQAGEQQYAGGYNPDYEQAAMQPEREFMVSQEQIMDAITRTFFADDLNLQVSTEAFDQAFIKGNIPLQFALNETEGFTDGALNQRMIQYNQYLTQLHNQNLMEARTLYLNLMSKRVAEIQTQLDTEDSGTEWGMRKRRLEDMRDTRLSQSDAVIERRKQELIDNFEARMEEEAQAAATAAKTRYKQRFGKQHDDDLFSAEAKVRSEIQSDFQTSLHELYEERRTRSLSLLDLNVDGALHEITEVYRDMFAKESELYSQFSKEIDTYTESLHVEAAQRVILEEERLRQTNLANEVREEMNLKLNTMEQDFKARMTALEAERDAAVRNASESVSLMKQQKEEERALAEQRERGLQEQLEKSIQRFQDAEENVKRDYEHRMQQAHDNEIAWQNTLESYKLQHKHNNVIAAVLVVAIVAACLAGGFVGGYLYNQKVAERTTYQDIVDKWEPNESGEIDEKKVDENSAANAPAAAAPADGAEEAPADSAGDAPADKPAE